MTMPGVGVSIWACLTNSPRIRVLVHLEFTGESRFQRAGRFLNLAPGLNTKLREGLTNTNIDGECGSAAAHREHLSQVSERWAVLGSVGWQQWSNFGQVQVGVQNTLIPPASRKISDFKDTWHFAAGAQYRLSEPWLLNFGVAYDTESRTASMFLRCFQRTRPGGLAQASSTSSAKPSCGFASEYFYGGTLDINVQSQLPVELGSRAIWWVRMKHRHPFLRRLLQLDVLKKSEAYKNPPGSIIMEIAPGEYFDDRLMTL